MKQYIGISRDHSRSMYPIAAPAARDYNDNIAAIREASVNNTVDTIISVVKCGVGPEARVVRDVTNSNISVVQPIAEREYVADGYGTPLFDSIGELIEMLQAAPDAGDPGVSFLVMAVTDGEENDSRRWSAARLRDTISRLQATDRWTFVFRVPVGSARTLLQFGIHPGNILEWEQSERGIQRASEITRTAFTGYFAERTRGVKSTNRFYADLDNVPVQQVQAHLVDISGNVQKFFVDPRDNGIAIKDFAARHVTFRLGTLFYQLSKTEVVQEQKKIMICDRATGAIYTGQAARNLLNLPIFGEVRLAPGQMGNYDVFVQSTSVNRKLVGGSHLIYWQGGI